MAHISQILITGSLLACSGPLDSARSPIAVANVDVDGTDDAAPVSTLVRLDEAQLCGGECEWREDTPGTASSRALAARARDALLVDFIRTAKAGDPTDSICAPDLVAQLTRTPQLLIYFIGDAPISLLAGSGLNFRRASTAPEYKQLAKASKTPIGYLEIVIDGPTALAGSSTIGVSYSCENMMSGGGLQSRGGVVLERDASTLFLISSSGFDE